MSAYYELTRGMVRSAVAECRTMGREAFLAEYGFKAARDYLLIVDDQEYDSKAIVAVAHKYSPSYGRALTYKELSGGLQGAVASLLGLGFEVRPTKDPDWTRDEHILALCLYLTSRPYTPDKGSKDIADLSALLNRLAQRRGVLRTDKFRNANGVYMKLMNFRRLDPEFRAAGKVGLTRGAGGEREVWDAYAHDLPGLEEAAIAIRLAIADTTIPLSDAAVSSEYEAEEWGVRLSVHLRRERDPEVVRLKKEAVLKERGCLKCEVCNFDFSARYGKRGDGFIEAHHRRPVSELKEGEITRADDLALVCANCHRMLHRGLRLASVEELRSQLRPL